MEGWNSRYDYKNMSNIEKLAGRRLHTQDNCWFMAKVLYVVLAIILICLIKSGDLNPRAFVDFYNSYLK